MKNFLLTGRPSSGKTTAIIRLVERLSNICVSGFYTRELREGSGRVGFEAVGLSCGRQATLAHVRSKSRLRVGRYGVEPAALISLVRAELDRPSVDVDVIVIDEIGKMELFCDEFVTAVRRLLDSPVPVLATLAMKGGGLIADVKARVDVRLVEVTAANRDSLPEYLEAWVRSAAAKGGM